MSTEETERKDGEKTEKFQLPSISPKRKSRKRARDKNAPAAPANSFTRFMVARRSRFTEQHPELSYIDVTKRLGEEWKSLSAEGKEIYMQQAAEERKEYHKELAAYKKTDSYKQFRKKAKRQPESRVFVEAVVESSEIPIFSKEFLDLNRQRESELRRLRVEVVRLEDEQEALDSNIARLRKAVEQLETEMVQEKELSSKIHSHLDVYRRALVQAFAHMPFPGTNIVPTITSIDRYMNNIHKLLLEAPGEHQDFVAKVRDIVTKLKLPPTPT